jgi:hypothetical protein
MPCRHLHPPPNPTCDLVMPALSRSMSGLTNRPLCFSLSPCLKNSSSR